MKRTQTFDEFLVDVAMLPKVTLGYVYTYNDAVKDEYRDRISGAIIVVTLRTHFHDTQEEAEEELMQKCIAMMDGRKHVFIREMPNVACYDDEYFADMPGGWYGRARIGVSND